MAWRGVACVAVASAWRGVAWRGASLSRRVAWRSSWRRWRASALRRSSRGVAWRVSRRGVVVGRRGVVVVVGLVARCVAFVVVAWRWCASSWRRRVAWRSRVAS
ncbi:hypothetical protein ACXZ9C_10785 [Streptococcus agalactiae]